jgi:hypothetical protein
MQTATRWLDFMTIGGLLFEHTRSHGGQATEVALTENHGNHHQHGMATKAPILLWKNYAKENPDWQVPSYWTTLDNIDVKLEWFQPDVTVNCYDSPPSAQEQTPQRNFASMDATLVEADTCFDNRQVVTDRQVVTEASGGNVVLTVNEVTVDRNLTCSNMVPTFHDFAAANKTLVESDKYFDERNKKVQADNKLRESDNLKKTTLAREQEETLKEHLAIAFKLSPRAHQRNFFSSWNFMSVFIN